MNERIRELWSHAGGHYNSGNQHTWPEYTITDPKKFAELIVQEMLAITDAHTEVFQTDRDKALIEHIKQSVKQHFGVVE